MFGRGLRENEYAYAKSLVKEPPRVPAMMSCACKTNFTSAKPSVPSCLICDYAALRKIVAISFSAKPIDGSISHLA